MLIPENKATHSLILGARVTPIRPLFNKISVKISKKNNVNKGGRVRAELLEGHSPEIRWPLTPKFLTFSQNFHKIFPKFQLATQPKIWAREGLL